MKNSTFTKCILVLVVFVTSLIGNTLQAQITKTVALSGGDYTSIGTALTTELPNIPDNGTLTINVGEGTFNFAATTTMNWPALKINIIVQGAGVTKTIQRAAEGLEARISPDVAGLKWLILSNAAGVTSGTGSITVKDMTFQYIGSYKNAVAAGSVVSILSDAAFDAKFENVEFNNCVGSSLINGTRLASSLTIENCLFKECVSTPRRDNMNDMLGLINKAGGSLTVKNTTFYNNENADVDSPTPSNGFVVNAVTTALYPSMNVVLENNAFVNNKNVVAGYIALSSVVSLKPGLDATGTFNVTMKKNIMVGNQRASEANDVDLQIVNPEKLTWVASEGNILSKTVKQVGVGVFEAYPITGCKIDATYTYTDSRINFIMDGTLPKLTADNKGIGKVTYSGNGGITVGINANKNNNLKAYVSNKTLFVKGLNIGSTFEIYSLNGTLVSKTVNKSDQFQINMPNGIYLLKSGNSSLKVIVQ